MIARLRPLLLFAAAGGCMATFHALGKEYYDGFHLPQRGMEWLLPQELALAALFALLAGAAVALLTAGLAATPLSP